MVLPAAIAAAAPSATSIAGGATIGGTATGGAAGLATGGGLGQLGTSVGIKALTALNDRTYFLKFNHLFSIVPILSPGLTPSP